MDQAWTERLLGQQGDGQHPVEGLRGQPLRPQQPPSGQDSNQQSSAYGQVYSTGQQPAGQNYNTQQWASSGQTWTPSHGWGTAQPHNNAQAWKLLTQNPVSNQFQERELMNGSRVKYRANLSPDWPQQERTTNKEPDQLIDSTPKLLPLDS